MLGGGALELVELVRMGGIVSVGFPDGPVFIFGAVGLAVGELVGLEVGELVGLTVGEWAILVGVGVFDRLPIGLDRFAMELEVELPSVSGLGRMAFLATNSFMLAFLSSTALSTAR